jgi:hypothetical protein
MAASSVSFTFLTALLPAASKQEYDRLRAETFTAAAMH